MRIKRMIGSVLVAGALFCTMHSNTEAVTTVAELNTGNILVDEASIYWRDDKEFNALIYVTNKENEVIKRGVYTFKYLKEYAHWYYHPLNLEGEFVRVDVDHLEHVCGIAIQERENKVIRNQMDKTGKRSKK